MRNKLVRRGPSSLTDEELLGVVLGGRVDWKNSAQVFDALKKNMWLLKRDFSSFFKMLLNIKGVGPSKASLIGAAIELGSRLMNERTPSITQVRDILPYISYLTKKSQECFVCINLNGGNRVISSRVVTIGLVDQALVHPREVFSEAVKERAAKVIVAHNHPAGVLSPSEEDIQITKNLLSASKILGITFLDHIIVTEDDYYSFREEGLL
ncbi:MAG: DNA repair protein RadC [Spirochaetota bacterium]|nr:MAG: DNA repair protein RadC [Spirochaetota bacterium]